jgi:hypothetical protein
MWEELNPDPGGVQIVVPAEPWRRRAFNGLAQVIVQAGREPGTITITASAAGLQATILTLEIAATRLQADGSGRRSGAAPRFLSYKSSPMGAFLFRTELGSGKDDLGYSCGGYILIV